MKTILNSFLLLQFFCTRYVYSTMSTYCLQTLNTSDCNETPIKVFSYYKPGSRCELEVWRGCPTGNKFVTEEECSEVCIFNNVEIEKKVKHKLDAKCMLPDEVNNCNDRVIHGFKYDKLVMDCVEVDSNCPLNIFEEKLECIQACVRDLTWEEKIKLISAQQSRELDEILDSFSNSTEPDEEVSSTQTTVNGELTTMNVGKTDDNIDTKTVAVTSADSHEVMPAEDKKLKGGDDSNSTQSHDNKESANNPTSANNEASSIGGGTSVSGDGTAASNAENVQQTSDQNAITTMNIGTQAEVVVA